MRCDQYALNRYRKPTNFAWHLPSLYRYSTNTSQIANVKAGGERAANCAQSTYWSCYNTIRTQILNWNQSCTNCNIRTAVQIQPTQKPTVLCQVRLITRQYNTDWGFGQVWDRSELIFRSKLRLLVGCLDPLLDNLKVCESQSSWHVGNGIPSVKRTKDSQDACCHGGPFVWGRKGFLHKT